MTENEELQQTLKDMGLHIHRVSFLLGTIMGQLSNLLNEMAVQNGIHDHFYQCLLDVHRGAALQIHEIFYKPHEENK